MKTLRSALFLSLVTASPLLLCRANGQQKPQAAAVGPSERARQLLQEEEALKARLARWKAALAQVCKTENAAILFDIPLDLNPPNTRYGKQFGGYAMLALADSTGREWRQLSGVQTFSAARPHANVKQVTEALNWINTLPENEFKRLLVGSTAISDLDPDVGKLIRQMGAWEPDMGFALLDHGQDAQIRVQVSPRIRFTDPKTGSERTLPIPVHYPRGKRDGSIQKAITSPLDPAPKGKLDFGTGSILKLGELAFQAGVTFKVKYAVDARIADNRYFVSGSYDEPSFTKALEAAATVPPVVIDRGTKPDRKSDLALLRSRILGTGGSKLDFTSLRDRLGLTNSSQYDLLNQQFGASEQMDASAFLNGTTMSASDLDKGMPGLTAFLQSMGVPQNAVLTLDTDIILSIQADGQHLMSNGSYTVDGQTYPAWEANETDDVLE